MLSASDDLLHDPGTDRLFTETNWFGFVNVEPAGISFGIYVGFKPNLGLSYCWIVAFQGDHLHHASVDYFNRRQFMRLPEVTGSGYELDNGLKVSILKPLETFRLQFADEPRAFAIDVVWDAICPPTAWTKSGHFDHFGRVRGTLTLHGQEHAVDTFAQRDHSWSVRDDETLPAVPPRPFAWVWGAFSDDFAFQAAANWALTTGGGPGDNVSATPVRAGGGGEKASWIWKDGKVSYTEEIDFEILAWDGLMRPRKVRIGFRTEAGETFAIDGQVLSAALIPNTFNFSTLVCQVHWTYGDITGIGDFHLSITAASYRGAGG